MGTFGSPYLNFMKTYYIYHIPGVKIGCTSQLTKRMSDQGFTEWEILEEHTDIYIASDREIELQKEYGLPVDKVLYWKSINNRKAASKAKGSGPSKGCKVPWLTKLTLNEVREIRSKYIPRKYTQYKLAKEYGVARTTIQKILEIRSYKEL